MSELLREVGVELGGWDLVGRVFAAAGLLLLILAVAAIVVGPCPDSPQGLRRGEPGSARHSIGEFAWWGWAGLGAAVALAAIGAVCQGLAGIGGAG